MLLIRPLPRLPRCYAGGGRSGSAAAEKILPPGRKAAAELAAIYGGPAICPRPAQIPSAAIAGCRAEAE